MFLHILHMYCVLEIKKMCVLFGCFLETDRLGRAQATFEMKTKTKKNSLTMIY